MKILYFLQNVKRRYGYFELKLILKLIIEQKMSKFLCYSTRKIQFKNYSHFRDFDRAEIMIYYTDVMFYSILIILNSCEE